MRNAFGEFVPGTVEEIDLQASVQPLGVEDVDVVGGARLSDRRKVYIADTGDGPAVAAAFGDALADKVLIDGTEFVVEESRYWPGSHTRATVLQET